MLTLARDTAFCDDEESYAATLASMQQKADIKSAVALVLRLPLAIKKFRFHSLKFTSEKTTEEEVLRLHTKDWKEILLSPCEETSVKYLGALQEVGHGSRGDMTGIEEMLKVEVKRLSMRMASPEALNLVLGAVVGAAVTYKASCACWALEEYTKLDVCLRGVLKPAMHLAKSFPVALMYAPRKAGGMQIYSIAANCQKQKYRLLRNALAGDNSTKTAAESLIMRAVRDTGGEWLGGVSSVRGEFTTRNYWSRSLVEELNVAACQLKTSSGLEGNLLDTPLSVILQNWLELRVILEELELNTLGDIVESEGKWGWKLIDIKMLKNVGGDFWRLTSPKIYQELKRPLIHLLRPGQIWMKEGEQHCEEILGWNADLSQYCIKRWEMGRLMDQAQLNKWRKHKKVDVFLRTKSQGAGSGEWRAMNNCEEYSHRVLMGRDSTGREGQLKRTIFYRTKATVKARARKVWEKETQNTNEESICTDGSWMENMGSPGDTAKHEGGCGIAILKKGTRDVLWRAGFRMTEIQTPQRAFTMEMIAAAMGYWEGSKRNANGAIEIHTDCKSAITTFGKGSSMRHHHPLKLIVRAVRGIFRRHRVLPIVATLNWVRGHPEERYASEAAFTPIEYGNSIADGLADSTEGSIPSVEEALRMLAGISDSWEMWTTGQAAVPMLLDPFMEAQMARQDNYLKARPECRGRVTKEELRWLRESRGPCSMTQWGAWLKLITRRFNRDMEHAQKVRCSCTWGYISVSHFRETCKGLAVTAIKKDTITKISELCSRLPESAMVEEILRRRLQSEDDIWRGQWTKELWTELRETGGHDIFNKAHKEVLMEITTVIAGATLECFGVEGHNAYYEEEATEEGHIGNVTEAIEVEGQKERKRERVNQLKSAIPRNTVKMKILQAAATSQKITSFFSGMSAEEDGD